MELAPTAVRAAAGDDVSLLESDPPGLEDLAGAVVVALAGAPLTVVVVFEPTAVVVVAPATVVVVAPAAVLVVVAPAASAFLWWVPDFLAAVGVDDPQAAVINPPARTTAPTVRNERARRRVAGWGDRAESGVVKVLLPHSSCGSKGRRLTARRPRQTERRYS
jgi:hypothetical protein